MDYLLLTLNIYKFVFNVFVSGYGLQDPPLSKMLIVGEEIGCSSEAPIVESMKLVVFVVFT